MLVSHSLCSLSLTGNPHQHLAHISQLVGLLLTTKVPELDRSAPALEYLSLSVHVGGCQMIIGGKPSCPLQYHGAQCAIRWLYLCLSAP